MLREAVDLFFENVTLVHCLVVACSHGLPFFLYLKEYIIFLEFGSTVACGMTRETRLAKHKAVA